MSEEVEVYRPQSADLFSRAMTDDWYDSFPNIVKLAEYVADTEFVPDAMRRHPAAIAAAILTGREMGLPPMVALRHLYIVRGRVGQSAELMRAQIYRAGHEIRFIESTDQRCVVEGRRSSESEWTRVQFTAEDAKKAGIDLRGYASDKLVARATSRLARRKFPDAVMGLPTVDELEDSAAPAEVVELAPGPPVKRQRASRRPQAASTQPKPAQPAPAEHDDDINELLDDIKPPEPEPKPGRGRPPKTPPPEPEPNPRLEQAKTRADEAHQIIFGEPEPPAEPEPRLTPAQLKRIQAQFRDLAITEPNDRHTIIAHIHGRPCDDTADQTIGEAHKTIETLLTWYLDEKYPIADRIREILNEAALREAAQETDTDEPTDDE